MTSTVFCGLVFVCSIYVSVLFLIISSKSSDFLGSFTNLKFLAVIFLKTFSLFRFSERSDCFFNFGKPFKLPEKDNSQRYLFRFFFVTVFIMKKIKKRGPIF